MSLRDDLLATVDDARALADELGVRVRMVSHVVRTWSGGEPGAGTLSSAPTPLTPTPRVDAFPRTRWEVGGTVEEGDLLVRQVSAQLNEAWLRGADLTAADELVYLVDGEPYHLMGLARRPFEFQLHLRRIRL